MQQPQCLVYTSVDAFQCITVGFWIIIAYDDVIHDSKVHGGNMGPIWGRQDPGGPHVGPMKFAIWDDM